MAFDCPRCRASVDERYYGPCGSCRAELRVQLVNEGHEAQDTRFVPKMHVTPNAVALKE